MWKIISHIYKAYKFHKDLVRHVLWSTFQFWNILSWSLITLSILGQWSDTSITCAGGHELWTHRILLAASSSFLSQCLQLSAVSDDETVKIILPDFSYEDVKKFLDTIYLNNSADGCLLQQYLNKIDHAHSRQLICDPHDYVKHEEKVKKLPVEIKMEASTEIQEATKKFQLDDLELISLDDDNNSSAKKTSFECSQCGKVFKKRRILRSHILSTL